MCRMAWPIIEGVSILHWHCNRGKRSLTLDRARTKPRAVPRSRHTVPLSSSRGAATARSRAAASLYERLQEANPRSFRHLSGVG